MCGHLGPGVFVFRAAASVGEDCAARGGDRECGSCRSSLQVIGEYSIAFAAFEFVIDKLIEFTYSCLRIMQLRREIYISDVLCYRS